MGESCQSISSPYVKMIGRLTGLGSDALRDQLLDLALGQKALHRLPLVGERLLQLGGELRVLAGVGQAEEDAGLADAHPHVLRKLPHLVGFAEPLIHGSGPVPRARVVLFEQVWSPAVRAVVLRDSDRLAQRVLHDGELLLDWLAA